MGGADARGVRGSPTVRRRRLGAELRRYRESAGLTIDAVAERLDCSASKVSRLETGQTGASPRDVRDMLLLYQVAQPELEELMEVARETRQRGWWRPYGSVLTGAYVSFEAAAQSIRAYEAQCVPGLLQTEGYARALMGAARLELTPAEFDKRVYVRMQRQALLSQADPVELWCVLDEAALLRRVGGAEVMRAQWERLIEDAARPNVVLQVLPLDAGAHPGMDGSFVLLRFPDEVDADTVYVAFATGGVFQDKADELSRYSAIFALLAEQALTPDASVALIAKLVKESA
jgi:transcriptional regulator with XRE-family HTH domain